MNKDNQTLQQNKVSFARYASVVISSIIIMLCSGAVYGWSIYVIPLKETFGLSTADTQLVYGTIIGVFTIVMLFVYKVMGRYGCKVSGAIGAILFSAGYFVASLCNGNIVILVLGIGVLSGSGMAFGYVTVLNTLVKWFPSNRGLATGVAVAGFGGGAILMTQVGQPLLDGGMPVLSVFRMVAIIYGILFFVFSLILSAPAGDKEKMQSVQFKLGGLLKDKIFWLLFYVFFAGSFAGVMLFGVCKPLGLSYGVDANITIIAVSLLSLGNAAGRIIWGQIHDMIGGKKSVVISLTLLALFTLLILVVGQYNVAFLILALLIGLSYGANFVTYASDVTRIYGVYMLSIIYPIVSLGYGLAGVVAPWVVGTVFDVTDSYKIGIIISVVVCATGIVAYGLLMPKEKAQVAESVSVGTVDEAKLAS